MGTYAGPEITKELVLQIIEMMKKGMFNSEIAAELKMRPGRIKYIQDEITLEGYILPDRREMRNGNVRKMIREELEGVLPRGEKKIYS